ncbi:MAG TPA: PEP-CTERM sorting domain-containing protein [Bryobacteraceae bacterium]|nr:PEP-CTERM sorting domain-containing protein [Bryobacteraceae bacterium]
MVRAVGLAVLVAPLLLGTPVSFTGHGEISGANGFFDLTGDGFSWHVSTDSTSFMGALCQVGESCNLGLFFTADSLSDVTSVYGHWDGRDWGGPPPGNVRSDSDTYASWRFPSGVAPGSRVSVPLAISGFLGGPELHLVFSGAGSQWITVMSVDQGNAGVIFGPFDFSGTIASDGDSVPEPGTLALALLGSLAIAGLRRAGRAVT